MDGNTVFGGSSPAPKALRMQRFPLDPVICQSRRLGHPIRLAGRNGSRLRIKSRPAGKRGT